jgi:hypothetical protein
MRRRVTSGREGLLLKAWPKHSRLKCDRGTMIL